MNLFHGRVEDGLADIGSVRIDASEHKSAEASQAIAYVRPHDIDLSREELTDSLQGTVTDIRPLGGIVRLLLKHNSELIEVELSRERYQQDNLAVGDVVYFKPRQAKVFLEKT